MNSGFFKKLLLFIIIAIFLNALLISIVFSLTSYSIFANMKSEEMLPKAKYLASIAAQYQSGNLSAATFRFLASNDRELWDATVHIYDVAGRVIAETEGEYSDQTKTHLKQYLPDVLSGTIVTAPFKSGQDSLIVGTPIYGADAVIVGAVFLSKPFKEVNAALNGFHVALGISVLFAFLIMLIPAYFGSKTMTRPLKQMMGVANAMAKGDFSVRATEHDKDEVGQLGTSFNLLSDALSHTIGDLTLEHNRLRNILDGLGEGIIAVDAKGHITHYNTAAGRLLGKREDQRIKDIPSFLKLWDHIGRVIQNRTIYEEQLSIGERVLRVTISPVAAGDGNIVSTVVLIQDVTEAERLEQTRRDYVANVSHELRTPIASVRGLAEALNDGVVKEGDKSKYYGYILHESIRLSRLIDDLLELSRLQSSGVKIKKRSVDIQALLWEIADRFQYAAEDKGIRINIETAENMLKGYTNEDRIEQVLIALVDNAMKYGKPGGTVTLSAQLVQDKLHISVRSTGVIDEEDLPHVFERFYKADKAHAEEGTGLGLAIVKEVVALLQESIWAENRGNEAVFTFTVSIADGQ